MIDRSKFNWPRGLEHPELAQSLYNALCDLSKLATNSTYFAPRVIFHESRTTIGEDIDVECGLLDKLWDLGLAERVEIICPPSESYSEISRFGYRAV